MIMGYSIAKLVMKSFIGTVIVLGFFGPYMISIILGLLCLAVWAGCRSGVRTPRMCRTQSRRDAQGAE